MDRGASDSRRLIESFRLMLAIIAGLLMLDMPPATQGPLSIALLAFSAYAVILLWQAANGSALAQHRVFYWLDSCWFLLLFALADEARMQYFLFLFFPVFFADWRTGYRESVAVAAFSSVASLLVIAYCDPAISWTRQLALPLSLFVVGPLFVALAQVEVAAQKGQTLAASIQDTLETRRSYDSIITDLIVQIARHIGASAAILTLRTHEGGNRVFCWEEDEGSSELSPSAGVPVAEQALMLADDVAIGWSESRHWWKFVRHIALGPGGVVRSPGEADHGTLLALASLLGKENMLSVPLSSPGIGRLRLTFAGESIKVNVHSLASLVQIAEQISPSVENIFLRERLATEAAETERARIGRDLHDSAIQPYIGLKFGLEALQRRAGADNPIATDLANLVSMATKELTTMREVISGLRGAPGNGGAMLSNAVRRQASRFGQLFGVKVVVEIEGEMPVSRRIAGELFHIVAEGLSNIRRHTKARRAWIRLSAADSVLVLSIRNEIDPKEPAVPDFTPVSLSERAAAMGGDVEVKHEPLSTTVTVRVPIPAGRSRIAYDDEQSIR